MIKVVRSDSLAEKVVFVDGLPGCGKTLFSTLISAMARVELLSYTYEIEHICELYYLDKITKDAAITMVSMQADLRIYNVMMGRDVNFRPSDLSSVMKYHDPSKYFQRILKDGDENVPDIINQIHPILNFSVHNLLAYSEPIWDALGDRCVFIEIVRHPLYMIRQQTLNMKNLIGNIRDFTVYYSHNGQEFPYYVKDWENQFIGSTDIDRVIYFIDNISKQTKKAKTEFLSFKSNRILTIPFESFVLSPDHWMDSISGLIGTDVTDTVKRVMIEQNVPRSKVAQGIDLEIYRRCGWEPGRSGLNERDELNIRRADIVKEASHDAVIILDQLCIEYEKQHWSPSV